jgi:hypothetical protein
MFVKYGSYVVPSGQAWVNFTYRPRYNSGGIQDAQTRRWDINGMLLNSGGDPVAFTAAVNGLINAFSVNGQDLSLLQNDGVTTTAHFITNSQTIGGTRVVETNFPEGKGAAYVTHYLWHVAIEADMDIGYNGLQAFFEVVSWVGGGPEFIMLKTLNGPSQKQFVVDETPYRATQRGSAIGFRAYPSPPPPLWPYAWHQDQSPLDFKSPKRAGPPGQAFYTDFEVSWNYSFEDASPMGGTPNIWTP